MSEQSHKDEMRAALRGDFERLRARRGDPGATARAEARSPAAAARDPEQTEPLRERAEATPSRVPDEGIEGRQGSWLRRLLRRR